MFKIGKNSIFKMKTVKMKRIALVVIYFEEKCLKLNINNYVNNSLII